MSVQQSQSWLSGLFGSTPNNPKTQSNSTVARDATMIAVGVAGTLAAERAIPYVKPYAVKASVAVCEATQATTTKVVSLFKGDSIKATGHWYGWIPLPGVWGK